jgi:predicted RNA binding protein YcfA (HicA-like mRNA interferase family)
VAKLSPISWSNLVKKLKKFGFNGPYQGGKHPYMVKGNLVLTLPNPHRKEIGIDLLIRILRQANIDKERWVEVD